jgi:type VI secretion system protein ImpL
VVRLLTSPIFHCAVAGIVLLLVIWLLGDFLGVPGFRPLDSLTSKFIASALVLGMVLAIVGIIVWRRRRRGRKMAEELVEVDSTNRAINAEKQALHDKFADAMQQLSRITVSSRLRGRRYVYDLPWYIFIGPPGAGKTWALERSGLQPALGDRHNLEGLKEGTRNIEWAFTDQAVFIDTAGRFVTQDSQSEVDGEAWRKLLESLKRFRSAEPINGIIVALPVDTLSTEAPADLENIAAKVRDRLQEITLAMQADVPVYVMLTKADLLLGFNEFFQGHSSSEWEQVWGVTFRLPESGAPGDSVAQNLERATPEYDRLVDRLGEILLARLAEERDSQTRGRLFGFPGQVASLRDVVVPFLRSVFQPRPGQRPVMLRGFYFTSATQTGQPIDRLIARMATEFGFDRQAVAVASGAGRAYFLRGLLRDVILPEAGLVQSTMRGRRQAKLAYFGGLTAVVAIISLLGGGFYTVKSDTDQQRELFGRVLSEYEARAAIFADDKALNPVGDEDFERILPALNLLENERARLEAHKPPLRGLGISAMAALRQQADNAYRNALDDLLRSRLMFRLEGQMDAHSDHPGTLYNILKSYLTIAGRAGSDDDQFVQRMIVGQWQDLYPGPQQDLRVSLKRHLEAMLEYRLPARSINKTAVGQVRILIQDVSVAQRALNIMENWPAANQLARWKLPPHSIGNGRSPAVFRRRSGNAGDEGISGLYTFTGFHNVVVPGLGAAISAVADEEWVIKEGAREYGRQDLLRLKHEILLEYQREFIRVWDVYIEDLELATVRNIDDAVIRLKVLGGNASPLRDALRSIARTTQLTRPVEEKSETRQEFTKIMMQRVSTRANSVARLVRTIPIDEGTETISVNEHFEHLWVYASEESDAGVNELQKALRALHAAVVPMAEQDGNELQLIALLPAATELRHLLGDAPPFVARLVGDLLDDANSASESDVRTGLNQRWRTQGLRECKKVEGNYPFGTGSEVPIFDFQRVLGHNGELDKFFNKELAAYVDTSVSPWRWRRRFASLGIDVDVLRFFEALAEIREAFFPLGSTDAGVDFGVTLIAEVPDVSEIIMSVGGSEALFEAKDPRSFKLSWPGDSSIKGAEVRLVFNDGADTRRLAFSGTWGLFYLLDSLKPQPRVRGNSARIRPIVNVADRAIMLEFRMNSTLNPFAIRSLMRAFRCPQNL